MLLPTVSTDIIFRYNYVIWGEFSHSFTAMIRNALHIYPLKYFPPHVDYVVTLPC